MAPAVESMRTRSGLSSSGQGTGSFRRGAAVSALLALLLVGTWGLPPAGAYPYVTWVDAYPNPANQGDYVFLNASASVYNSSGYIAAMEYHMDDPNPTGGTGMPMNAYDGAFNEASESAYAYVDTGNLTPGDHAICVLAKEQDGNNSQWSSCGSLTLTVNGAPGNQPPVADAGPDQSGVVGQPVSFNGGGSSDRDGYIVSYLWDFGDGSQGNSISTSHTYSAPGVYTVTLTVTDNASATDTDTATVTITDPGASPPVANAGPDQSGLVSQTLTFNGNASYDPNGYLVSYTWDFGDGGFASGAVVTHAYSLPGLYTVLLTVTDNDNLTDSDTTLANITGTFPRADAGGPYSGRKNFAIGFDGTGSLDDGTLVSYAWVFGDGQVGSGPTPSHVYAAGGAYTVTLTVIDDMGLNDSDTTTATIEDRVPGAPTLLPAILMGGSYADVRLRWTLSVDDGGVEDDVAGYEIRTGTAYDASGASYSSLTVVPAGSTSYDHMGAGALDPLNHFYVVRAVEEVSGRVVSAAGQAGKFARYLTAGDQLISVPLEQADWRVGAVLQTIPWTRARTYVNPAGQGKNWLSNDRQKPWADLTTLSRTMAVWVKLSGGGLWAVAGLVPATTQVQLKTGWNFIGYASFADWTVGQVLAGISYQTVEGYANDPPHNLRRLTASDMMRAGYGFWVHVSMDAVLTLGN